jgi:peptidoglycan hydrolase CwlO-like protein
MKNTKKIYFKSLIYTFLAVLLISSVFLGNLIPSFAKTLEQLNKELEVSKNQFDNLHSDIQYYQNKISETQEKIDSLGDEIDNLTGNIEETDDVIADIIYRIQAKRESIRKASKDIVKKTIELQNQKEILTKIIQEMYDSSEQGEVNLLELLLYSKNFEEALNDVEYFNILHEQGEKSMETINDVKEELEQRKIILVEEEENLDLLLNSLEQSKEILKKQEEAKNFILEETKGKE